MLSSRRANSSDQDHSSGGRENHSRAVDLDEEKSENEDSEQLAVHMVTTKAEISPHQPPPEETTGEAESAIKAAAAAGTTPRQGFIFVHTVFV